ncbi:hypothetical protein [Hymenobacter cavernae]|uniref:SHOCT domain-containing protein n=1 Tax=Hymenobacter cavernae TaxID=2044852 RepID=A0ABQ1U8Y1_9BACT|nr:hypothetical protein [Hymenobacter cavernae]GGF11976.1 hypothetical protein GCM10011383_24020 [Hymenobacter cavernae]
MNLIKQKRYLNYRTIEFREEDIMYLRGNLIGSKQVIISYEEIQYEKLIREFKIDRFYMWVCILSGVTMIKSIAWLIENSHGIATGLLPLSFIFFVVFLITTLLSRKHVLCIPTYSSGMIELYDNNPSEADIKEFLNALKERIHGFLKRKYTTIDKDLPVEPQLEMLLWLKQRNILSGDEFASLKQQLIGNQSGVRGFNRD